MSPVELIALSLGASIGVAALAGLVAAGLERLCADPGLRERIWAVALYLPILPPMVVGGVMLTPAPVRVVELATPPTEFIASGRVPMPVIDPVVIGFSPDWLLIASITLGLALVLSAVRLASLGWRAARLHNLVAGTREGLPGACDAVALTARQIGVAAPAVRTTAHSTDALLTGAIRPLLILPETLATAPDSPAALAVIRHELAHLKRGDHRAVWLEEGLLALLAFNLVLPLIRARRAGAREEACDALALAGADAPARRAYAQSLIEALRARTAPMLAVPALTFTGSPRSQAMRRLKSILTPPAIAGRGMRIVAVMTSVGLVALSGLAGAALASQREPANAADDAPDAALARLARATAADLRLYCAAAPELMDRGQCSFLLFDVAFEESRSASPEFCPPPQTDAGLTAIEARGRAQILVTANVQGSAREGARRALIAAFPCNGFAREPARAEVAAAEQSLKAEWTAVHGVRAATEAARRAARMQAQTGAEIRAKCLGQGTEKAGCDGVIFGFTISENFKPVADRTFCAPESSDQAKALIARMETEMTATDVLPSESGQAYLSRTLRSAYPCRSAQAVAATTRVIPAGQPSPVSESYSVEAAITEDGVTYADRATASRQARLTFAERRYRMTVDRSGVDTDRRRSDIRIYRRDADGRETLIGAPSMVSARDATAQYRVGTEGGFMIDVTVGPPAQ